MRKPKDYSGQIFGRLTILEEAEKDISGHRRVKCKCSCGEETIARLEMILKGKIVSCGCYSREESSKRAKTHGHSKEKLYSVWKGMRRRCNNENCSAYKNYGGRGIKVCEEWQSDYASFRKFMYDNGYQEDGPFGSYTIDRIDNDGDYCPENCRVISIQEQAYNKSSNHKVNYLGKEMTITEACLLAKIDRKHVFNRINKGWSFERAISTPLQVTAKYEASGMEKDINEWAEYLNTTPATVRGRLSNGLSMQEILDSWTEEDENKEHRSRCTFYTVNEEKHSISDWSQILDIAYHRLRYLLKTHSMEEIVLGKYPNYPSLEK